jgi:hypothetical protein
MGKRPRAAPLQPKYLPWLLLIAALPAQAAVYRCGNSYRDTPCPGARTIAADDARTAQEQNEARQIAEQDAAMADTLEQKRMAQEARLAKELHTMKSTQAAQEAQARKASEKQAAAAAKAQAQKKKNRYKSNIPTSKPLKPTLPLPPG